jgi:predicted nuclease with TOPRIM domain
MMDLDKIAGRMIDLESKYYELQEKYQLLIHHYEDLKAEYEEYRNKRVHELRNNTVP